MPRRSIIVVSVLVILALVGAGIGIGFGIWGGGGSPEAATFPRVPARPGFPSIHAPASSKEAFLGVEVAPGARLTPAATAKTGTSTSTSPTPTGVAGAHVVGVVATSPAAKAGIVKGDTITAVDTRAVNSALALELAVRRHSPGDRVKVQWTTATGKHQSATVTLATGPAGNGTTG